MINLRRFAALFYICDLRLYIERTAVFKITKTLLSTQDIFVLEKIKISKCSKKIREIDGVLL